jgi:hypothetical protein
VAEKCPTCGHMEAYSKEMQVCILVFQRDTERMIVITATECRRGFDGILYGEYMLYCGGELRLTRFAVCIMQTRMAREQLMLHVHAD